MHDKSASQEARKGAPFSAPLLHNYSVALYTLNPYLYDPYQPTGLRVRGFRADCVRVI